MERERDEDSIRFDVDTMMSIIKGEQDCSSVKYRDVDERLKQIETGEKRLKDAYSTLLSILQSSSRDTIDKNEILNLLTRDLPERHSIFEDKARDIISKDPKARTSKNTITNSNISISSRNKENNGEGTLARKGSSKCIDSKSTHNNNKREPLTILERLNVKLKSSIAKKLPHNTGVYTNTENHFIANDKGSYYSNRNDESSRIIKVSTGKRNMNSSGIRDEVYSINNTMHSNTMKSYDRSVILSPDNELRLGGKQLDAGRQRSTSKQSTRDAVDSMLSRIIKSKNIERGESRGKMNRTKTSENIEKIITVTHEDNHIDDNVTSDKMNRHLLSPSRYRATGHDTRDIRQKKIDHTDYNSSDRNKSQILMMNRSKGSIGKDKPPRININLAEMKDEEISNIEILSNGEQGLHIRLKKKLKTNNYNNIPHSNTVGLLTPKKNSLRFGLSEISAAEEFYGYKNLNKKLFLKNNPLSSRNPSQGNHYIDNASSYKSHRQEKPENRKNSFIGHMNNQDTSKSKISEEKSKGDFASYNYVRDQKKGDHQNSSPFTGLNIVKRTEEVVKERTGTPRTIKETRDCSKDRVSISGTLSTSNYGKKSQRSMSKTPLNNVDRWSKETSSSKIKERKDSAEDLKLIEEIQTSINTRFHTIEQKLTSMGGS